MAKRMLIDASHPEETRVVVLKGKRLEEFDFESNNRRPLKGNIYLAKVTRVEPSLQAAFVDYGGNRHGFLSFNEIHPDYYQIPVEDRAALIEQERAAEEEALREEEQADDAKGLDAGDIAEVDEPAEQPITLNTDDDAAVEDEDEDEVADSGNGVPEAPDGDVAPDSESVAADEDEAPAADASEDTERPEKSSKRRAAIEAVGGDVMDEVRQVRRVRRRAYKIQEVIKRRQILLVQVVKEERGNKGAALTSYISLAGRYCVLMPNTGRGGGISRKITNPGDRKRLKTIARQLDVPEGMGVIVRTAGLSRNKSEIKRDYEYLLRMWNQIRDVTLNSTAPCLVHEEANQIKRAIRDLYDKDIEEVTVDGEEGYRAAKSFMRTLMPSHAKRVQPYRDSIPLYHRFQVDQQLDAMYSATVTLPSGGYIVINPTEALVAIDVNSGRATKDHNIEETALRTNTEAAEEVARQLRLRDLAGLIVIDFIDMEVHRNNRSVERRIKECLRADRARIQVGRISGFGLLEMSRQRLRPGVHEVNMESCVHCNGAGVVRSTDSTALYVLRAIEEEGIRKRAEEITVFVPGSVAVYILNQKRRTLTEIEQRYDLTVNIQIDETLIPPNYRIEKIRARTRSAETGPAASDVKQDTVTDDEDEIATHADTHTEDTDAQDDEGGRKRRRRRRRRRKPGEDTVDAKAATEESPAEGEVAASDAEETVQAAEPDGDASDADDKESVAQKRRRRGRRGGRRRTSRQDDTTASGAADQPADADEQAVSKPVETASESPEPVADAAPAMPEQVSEAEPAMPEPVAEAKPNMPEPVAELEPDIPEPVAETVTTTPPPAPEAPTDKADTVVTPLPIAAAEPETPEPPAPESEDEEAATDKPRRRGWWSRRLGSN